MLFMKTIKFVLYLSIILLFESCDSKSISTRCKSVNNIQVKNYCYNALDGLALVAIGQDESQNGNQFIWYLYPQIDTVKASINISSNNEHIILGLNGIIIQDSLINSYPKFILKITSSCSRDQITSEYFHFVKRFDVRLKCYNWQVQ